MKITREVNGELMDFELTKEEIYAAYAVQEASYDLQDVLEMIANYKAENPDEYPEEFYEHLSGSELPNQWAKEFRDGYFWSESGYEQMYEIVNLGLSSEYSSWDEARKERELIEEVEKEIEDKSTPPIPNKPYAEYHITMTQEDEDCFHELRTALERAEFPVNDWYEEDGVIHLNDVFTADASSSNYLLTLIRCYATMSNVTITVMELLSGGWTPHKIIFNGGMMERYIANVTYTRI